VAQYIGTALAVLAMRRRAGPSARLRLPLGPAIPIAATVVSAIFLAAAGWRDVALGAVLLAVGGVVGTVVRRTLGARAAA
jgi:hypothetical protein